MENFKSGFQRNFDRLGSVLDKAIEQIDKSIANLGKTKDWLLKSANQLRPANDKARTCRSRN